MIFARSGCDLVELGDSCVRKKMTISGFFDQNLSRARSNFDEFAIECERSELFRSQTCQGFDRALTSSGQNPEIVIFFASTAISKLDQISARSGNITVLRVIGTLKTYLDRTVVLACGAREGCARESCDSARFASGRA